MLPRRRKRFVRRVSFPLRGEPILPGKSFSYKKWLSMSHPDDDWDLIASELGAVVPPKSQHSAPAAKESPAPELPASSAAPACEASPPKSERRAAEKAKPTSQVTSDWDLMAYDFGLAGPEEPAETLHGSPVEMSVSEPEMGSTEGEAAADMSVTETSPSLPTDSAAAEAQITELALLPNDDFVRGLFPELAFSSSTVTESLEDLTEVSEATEEEEAEPSRRKRRRRGRRRSKRSESAVESAEEAQEPEDEVTEEESFETAEEEPETAAVEEEETGDEGAEARPKRRRRRRSSRKRRPETESAESSVEEAGEESEEDEDDEYAGSAESLADEDEEDEEDEEGEAKRDGRRVKAIHRGIPTWEEAMRLIVSANMGRRATSPPSRGRSGRSGRSHK